MPETRQVDVHSEQVQDIITEVPHWLVRWGISLFFIVLGVFVILSAKINFPDVIHGTVVFENEVPPEEILAAESGKLVKLFVKENSMVDSGDVLGFIQSTARHVDILTLSRNLDTLHQMVSENRYTELSRNEFFSNRHLGELQAEYQLFQKSFIEFKAFLGNGLYEQKKSFLEKELQNINAQNNQYEEQLALEKRDYSLAEKDYEAFKKLYERKVISQQEYRSVESKLIARKFPLQNTQNAIFSNNSSIQRISRDLIEIDNNVAEKKASFLSVVNQLQSQLEQWKRKYLLIANTSGKVVFTDRLTQGNWIKANSPVLLIESTDPGSFVGRLKVGQFSFGKVKERQIVLLKLDAYPYQEYGIIKGKIDYISDIAFSDSLYSGRVTLTHQNISTYKHKLHLKNGLIAQAEIVTAKRSILSKLFDKIYSLFKNGV